MERLKKIFSYHSVWKDALQIPVYIFFAIALLAINGTNVDGQPVYASFGGILLLLFCNSIGLAFLYLGISQIAGWFFAGRISCDQSSQTFKPNDDVSLVFTSPKLSPHKFVEPFIQFVYLYVGSSGGKVTTLEDVLVTEEEGKIENDKITFNLKVPEKLPFTGKSLVKEYNVRLHFGLYKLSVHRDFKVYVQ